MKRNLLIFFLRNYLNTLAFVNPGKAGKEGFMLFCRPQRRAVKPHHLEFFNTAEKFTVEYDQKKVQAYRWGSGPKKLLLLHGWESHSYWWKSIVTHLPGEEFSVLSVDAPGHGLSEGNYINIPHYSGLIEKLIITHGAFDGILGHSLGAFSTLYTFHRAPQLGNPKLIIMAAPGEVSEFVSYYKNVLGLSDRTLNATRDYFITKLGHDVNYFSSKAFAKTISNPGLIIHDQQDPDAPYAHALEVHRNWPNSRMISTTGLGHNLKSTELIKEVARFLNT